MEQNIFDYLVEGLDLNAFYSFIDSKTDIDKNTPKFVFQYTTWSALFNGIIRSDEVDDKMVDGRDGLVLAGQTARPRRC